jgi:hypothetical protein
VLDRAIGGNKDKGRRGAESQSAAERDATGGAAAPAEPADALGGLLDRALSGGDRETDAEKAARRERERQKKLERQAKEAAAATQPAATQPTEKPLTKKERERLKKEEQRKAREEKNRKAK